MIFASVGILIHSLLIFGAHANLNFIIYFWIFLTILCLTYLIYFTWYFGSLILDPKVNRDSFNANICYVIIAETILEMVLHVYGIFLASKVLNEMSMKMEKGAHMQVKVPTKNKEHHNTTINAVDL